MNILQKNITITVTFAILLASLFLTDSSVVHAVVAVLSFITVIALQTQGTSGTSSSAVKILSDFEEMIEFKRNKVVLNESTDDSSEILVNSIVNKYISSVQDDTKVAGEMTLLADKVAKGHLGCRVAADTKTPYVHVLRNIMNNLINSS